MSTHFPEVLGALTHARAERVLDTSVWGSGEVCVGQWGGPLATIVEGVASVKMEFPRGRVTCRTQVPAEAG